MRPQLVILVTLAVLGLLAADLPHAEGSWPCCDNCGVCNKKFPPDCYCNDVSVHGCHPKCKKCVRYTLTDDDDDDENHRPGGGGPGPVRTYRCADMLTNFCKRRCTPAPAVAAFLGEAF